MAAPAPTPFAASTSQQAPVAQTMAKPDGAGAVQLNADASKSFKLVKSPTGNNLYVESNEYDPLEHHRSRDKESNKGEGLGFMFCCCAPKVQEPAHTAERHYSMAASPSMDNIPDKAL